MAQRYFDRSLGVLDPRRIEDVAQGIVDVNSQVFWKFFQEGLYDASQLALLERKIEVRIRGASQTMPLERYAFLTPRCKGLKPLVAIGCVEALDAVPEPYAGSSPEHVAAHVRALVSKGRLRVQAAGDDDRKTLCQMFLEEAHDSTVIQVFSDLPIVKHGDRHEPLKKFSSCLSLPLWRGPEQCCLALYPGIVPHARLASACRHCGLLESQHCISRALASLGHVPCRS